MQTIELRTSRMWLGEDGIIRRVLRTGAVDEEADARETVTAFSGFGTPVPLPVLNDMRGLRSASAGARAVFSHPRMADRVRAVALLVDSPVTRMIGSFFLGLNRPPYPVALFTSEDEALRWLKKYL